MRAQRISPVVIFPDGASQDVVLSGPAAWLENSKAVTDAIYAGQPNPRSAYGSSFTAGFHRGANVFARSYHLDMAEPGTERRGGLITLGLASPEVAPSELAAAYLLGFHALIGPPETDDLPTTMASEDKAIASIFARHGVETGAYLARLLEDVFAVGRFGLLTKSRLSATPVLMRVSRFKAGSALLRPDLSRGAVYALALAMMNERHPTWWRLLRRAKLDSVLISQRKADPTVGHVLVRTAAAFDGMAEISLELGY